jgi:hypothetical protein
MMLFPVKPFTNGERLDGFIHFLSKSADLIPA